jgi:hypothetical protein
MDVMAAERQLEELKRGQYGGAVPVESSRDPQLERRLVSTLEPEMYA